MDAAKRQKLKAELATPPGVPLVSIERYFDGNDDEASIGCNLPEHPGIDVFRSVLAGLTRRSDVDAVYALISEIDPGEGFWPFTDTVLVVGTIAAEELQAILGELEPDDIGPAEDFGIPEDILSKHSAPVLAAWWD